MMKVKTLENIKTYKGTATQIFVQDINTGGLFYRDGEGKVDGGVIIADGLGRLWRREYDKFVGVNVMWWGAKGDGITDDINAFDAAVKYCTVTISEGTLLELTWRPTINIPNGIFRITRSWKLGGQSISATDALSYEWYNQSTPSYIWEEHRITADYVPISIIGSNRTYIFGDFKPDSLTAVISYGFYGYARGGFERHSAKIEGLKISGHNGFDYLLTGENTKQVGFLMEGGNGIIFNSCAFYGVEYGFIQNTSYFNSMRTMGFYNCGTGYYSIGSHSTSSWGWLADHCGIGFEIKSGASVYNQINTEQCKIGLIVGGGFNIFNGMYLEQLDGTSDITEYQLQIGYDDESFPVMGTTLIGATITAPNGILMLKTARGLDISGCNFVSSGTKTTNEKNTIYIRNSYTDIHNEQVGQILYPFGNINL